MAYALNEMYDGTPRVRISPVCRTLIVGMAGRYFNERDEAGELRPNKGKYSHVCDALQYGLLGLGEGRRMIGLKPTNEMRGMKVWARPQDHAPGDGVTWMRAKRDQSLRIRCAGRSFSTARPRTGSSR